MNPIVEAVCQHLNEHLSEFPSARILIAFSGGLDSTALLLAVCRSLQTLTRKPQVLALHVHHGLHADADAWAEHCEHTVRRVEFAASVTFRRLTVAVARQGNLEANARQARYQALTEQAQPGDLLLVAHHQQDQTETVLHQLFSGRGLLPMPAVGRMFDVALRRPLLLFTKEQLAAWVNAASLSWIEDGSNQDRQFVRNFLRHSVLPPLRERFTGLDGRVLRVAQYQQDQHQALSAAVAGYGDCVRLSELPEAVGARVAWLRAYLQLRGHHQVSDVSLQELIRQCEADSGGWLSLARSDYPALRGYARAIYYVAQEPAFDVPGPPQALRVSWQQTLKLPIGCVRLEVTQPHAEQAWCYRGPLQVRCGVMTERLRDAHGIDRSVADWLRGARVPPWLRPVYPLMFDAEQLVSIPNIAANSRYADQHGDAAESAQQRWCRSVFEPSS